MRYFTLVAIIVLLPTSGSATLVNHWSLDETMGSTATDSGSGGNDGAIGSNVNIGQVGKIGGAFDFQAGGNNAANSVVATGYKGILGGDARTVSAWIRADTLTGQQGIIGWGVNSTHDRWEVTRDGDKPRVNLNGDNWVGPDGSIGNTTDWFHVVFSLPDDGSPNINEGQMYLDGAAQTAGSINSGQVTTMSGIDLRIGRGQNQDAFDGLLDDIAIWDEDLTSGEVKGLFDVGDDAVLNYDAGQFDLLKMVHDAGAGSVMIDGLNWTFASGLAGANGLSGNTLILDQGGSPTAADGTGLVSSVQAAIPEPSTIALTALGLMGLAFRRRR